MLDASATVDLFLRLPGSDDVIEILRQARAFAAPAHLDADVASALARLHRRGEISGEVADEAVEELASAPVVRVPLAGLVAAAWDLRRAVAMADAFYVALAARFAAPLVTTDPRLAAVCSAQALCPVAPPRR